MLCRAYTNEPCLRGNSHRFFVFSILLYSSLGNAHSVSAMKILVACEYTGIVRDAFIRHGHDAMSCDLLDTESPGPHHRGDVLEVLNDGWDMMIAHPPCTHLATAGARWFKEKEEEQREALSFVRTLLDAPIERIALENPVGIIPKNIRPWRYPADQIIQPYWFGDEAQKSTCLWLKGLPPLTPTKMVGTGDYWVGKGGKRLSKWIYGIKADGNRGHIRSRTFEGIAEAMASQWGSLSAQDLEYGHWFRAE